MTNRQLHRRISDAEAGVRLDQFVGTLVGCSRARSRELLSAGCVAVSGRIAREADKGRRLAVGEKIEVDVIDVEAIAPSDAELVVLASGEGWVAVDKPAGTPVHPLRIDDADTMLQRVVGAYPQIEGVGEAGRRSGVVHRLDVDTSGVLLFAYEEEAWQRLRGAFRSHRIDKVYRALVRGIPPEVGSIELDLEIAAHRPARVVAVEAGAGGPSSRSCATRWRLLQRFQDAALVEVLPHSGFLHQVRVSFATMGHPLLGDVAYGGPAIPAGRHMLHAASLRFEEIEAESPDPEDFAAAIAALEEAGSGGR